MNKITVLLACSCFLLLGCHSLSVNSNGTSKTNQAGKIASKYQEFIHSGDTLPIESIVDLNGETVDLTDSKKRKLVIFLPLGALTLIEH